MPDWQLTDSFEANGVYWNLYDSGPRDGTLIIARGTAGPITVLVGTQSLSSDPPGTPTLPVAEAVVRSVVVDPTGSSAYPFGIALTSMWASRRHARSRIRRARRRGGCSSPRLCVLTAARAARAPNPDLRRSMAPDSRR
jgi:hypothetical protein